MSGTDGKIKATVSTRFEEHLAVKARRENRKITRIDVMNETGLTRYAVDGWANNTLKQTNLEDIAVLSAYFEVEPGELFVYSIEGQGENQDSPETEELPEAVGF